MSIIKALIGGVIGAVIATVALVYLRDGSMRGFEWFPLVTGLLTGLGSRLVTGSTGRSLGTGAVAALVSLVAILAGDELIEMWKLRDVDLGPVAGLEDRIAESAKASKSDSDADAGDADDTDSEDSEGESTTDQGDDSEDSGSADSDPADADAGDVGEPETDEATSDENSSSEAMDRARQEEMAARSAVGSTRDVGELPQAKRPNTLRDFLPYIFSGLGVLIAYQLGRGSSPQAVTSEAEPTQPATASEDNGESDNDAS